MLGGGRPRRTVLLNSPHPAEEVWDRLPDEVQQQVLAKDLDLWTIDASAVARKAGIGGRINTVMQACFFAHLRRPSPGRGDAAADRGRAQELRQARHRGRRAQPRGHRRRHRGAAPGPGPRGRHVHTAPPTTPCPSTCRSSWRRVTSRMIAGEGDLLPVSALPVDGAFPTGTAAYEKRTIATKIPIWESDLCIDCGKCTIVCPHAAIRMKRLRPGREPRPCRPPLQGLPQPGEARFAADDPGGAGRLHRVRRVRRPVPGVRQVRGPAQGDQHAAHRGAPRGRADPVGRLPRVEAGRLVVVVAGHRQDLADAPATDGVLRGVLRMR